MMIAPQSFLAIDWNAVPAERHDGETGHALWRTLMFGDMRVRRVDYSRGYVADHWCDRGHVLFVIAGEIINELKDGRTNHLPAGHGYVVSNNGDSAHRSLSPLGAQLVIVD